MTTFYRVMMKRTPDDEPETWTNYADLDAADEAARALTRAGVAVEAHVVRVDKHQGETTMPRVSKAPARFDESEVGTFDGYTVYSDADPGL